MKFFQQMLVAPAALGLLASGANAAELNINGVSDYAASADQVTSVTQFSDVYPTDWAYQALSNLVEQYGCVAGYPNGTFRGNRAISTKTYSSRKPRSSENNNNAENNKGKIDSSELLGRLSQ